MALLNDLKKIIGDYSTQPYETNPTSLVPDTNSVGLTFGNKGLTGTFAFLFVDIRNSSKLHEKYGFAKAAKIYQSFHDINVRVIEQNNGSIRAFDGDRIMGVFVGDFKNSNAAKASMQIQWAIRNILNPTLKTSITCGAGIDSGEILVAKVGKGRDINNNDLVWIGEADNYASHLANESENSVIISTNAYDMLYKDRKTSSDGRQMWNPRVITLKSGKTVSCFETGWGWQIH